MGQFQFYLKFYGQMTYTLHRLWSKYIHDNEYQIPLNGREFVVIKYLSILIEQFDHISYIKRIC